MKSVFKYCPIIFIVFLSIDFQAIAQQKKSDAQGNLFSAGYAAAFIGGLYDAWYPYSALKQHGDFGLGAPAGLMAN